MADLVLMLRCIRGDSLYTYEQFGVDVALSSRLDSVSQFGNFICPGFYIRFFLPGDTHWTRRTHVQNDNKNPPCRWPMTSHEL